MPLSRALLEALVAGRSDDGCAAWADGVTSAIDGAAHGVIIPLGELCRDQATAMLAARAVAEHLVASWRRRWSLDDLTPEIGADQVTEVAPGKRTRSLLPHHDGGNSSYLTPSCADVATWAAELRRTAPRQISTTRAHKLYQGFVVLQTGEGDSITPYYDLVTMLMLAYRHQNGVEWPSLPELQEKCARDLRRSIGLIQAQGGGYIQLGALLGASDPKHILVNLHNTDAPFNDAELAAFPEIRNGSPSPVQSLFEEMIVETTGLPWPAVCELTEQGLRTEQFDFVLGHNVILMHGGLNGGPSRLLHPICAVLQEAAGRTYENWLSANWVTAYGRATSVLARQAGSPS